MPCWWPEYGHILGSGIVDCFHGVMACCENCFVGISYATIGLENRVVLLMFD